MIATRPPTTWKKPIRVSTQAANVTPLTAQPETGSLSSGYCCRVAIRPP